MWKNSKLNAYLLHYLLLVTIFVENVNYNCNNDLEEDI